MGGTVWDHSPSFTEKKTRSDLGQRLSQLGHISFQTTYFVYYVVKYALKKKIRDYLGISFTGKKTRSDLGQSFSQLGHISSHILCTM